LSEECKVVLLYFWRANCLVKGKGDRNCANLTVSLCPPPYTFVWRGDTGSRLPDIQSNTRGSVSNVDGYKEEQSGQPEATW
jgi:hypothetical protein